MIQRIKKVFLFFWDNRFFRFLMIGGINTLFGYGIFVALIFFGVHYSLASFFSTVLGVLFNFKTTGFFVFRNKSNHLIFRFVGVYGVVYLTNLFFLFVFNHFGVSNYIAGALLLFPIAFFSYVLNRQFVFLKKNL